MSTAAQRNATRSYRARLAQRGIKRFEVMAPETDLSLIRTLGRRLAEDGPKADHVRATVKALIADEPRCAAEFLPRSVDRRWLVKTLTCRGRASMDARSTFDTLPS